MTRLLFQGVDGIADQSDRSSRNLGLLQRA